MKFHLALIFLPLITAGQNNVVSNDPMITYASIHSLLSHNNASQAIADFEWFVANMPDKERGENIAENYFGMALALALNGNYRESIHYHRKAMKAHCETHHEQSLEIKINLGLTYQLSGRERKARRILGELYIRTSEGAGAS